MLRYLITAAAVTTGFVSAQTVTTLGAVTIHTVLVGKGNNQYSPNALIANPGDIVTFQFYPTNHSVIKAQYGYPCIPYEDVVAGGQGFYSQPQAVATADGSNVSLLGFGRHQ